MAARVGSGVRDGIRVFVGGMDCVGPLVALAVAVGRSVASNVALLAGPGVLVRVGAEVAETTTVAVTMSVGATGVDVSVCSSCARAAAARPGSEVGSESAVYSRVGAGVSVGSQAVNTGIRRAMPA